MTIEFFNRLTGRWEEHDPPVDVTGLRKAVVEHGNAGLYALPPTTVLMFLDLLDAAFLVDAKFDGGTFGDEVHGLLIAVFGDTLVTLHDAVGRFTDGGEE